MKLAYKYRYCISTACKCRCMKLKNLGSCVPSPFLQFRPCTMLLAHVGDAREHLQQTLDQALRMHILDFCATSPSDQFNQLAVANRSVNIMWRQRVNAQLCLYMGHTIKLAQQLSQQSDASVDPMLLLNLANMADILPTWRCDRIEAMFTA